MSWFAYLVIGTSSPAATILSPALARSAGVATPPGFDVGTMTVSVLPAKFVTAPVVKPPSTSFCGLAVSAEAKTSAGAPSSICVLRALDASNDRVSVAPGVAAS